MSTLNFIYKLKTSYIYISRHKLESHIGKFSTASCLFLEHLTEFSRCCNSFLVCNLWCTLVTFDFELPPQTVNKYFKVKFTHTMYYCLSAIGVCSYLECRIFFSQLSKRD